MELRDYFIQEVKTRPRTRRGPATVKQKPRKKRVKEVRKAKQPAKKGSREKGKLRTEIQGGTTMGPVSDKDTGTVDFYNWPGAESKSKEMASKSTSVEKVGMRGSKEGMSKEAASRMDSKEKVSKSLSKESPSKRSRTTSRESASRKERNVKGPRRKGTQKKRVRKRKSKGTTSTSPEEMTGTRSQEG
ncbi:unnamed protein product [Heligmosomoides polygyrus]|uniref:Uncharacterized protein n=1 Tax=Heligmosomoides polygyrus TaxID=6339 RepID=A0A183G0N8_HELPZ|nr:unnamed protein product [Heligmosomoides polygyrus]